MGVVTRVSEAALAAAVLLAVPASAIVYVMPTDESMVDRSSIIVFGEVLSAQPGPDGRTPTTDYLFAVEEVLKGSVAGSITVRQPGGLAADGWAMWIAGLPMPTEGDRMLLFLRPEEEGAHRIVEYSLGMFWEVDMGGQLLLVREPSLERVPEELEDAAAGAGVASQPPRGAHRFRRWIADRASDVERSADYFEAELPEGPVAVVAAFRVVEDRCGLPARLPVFDRGESLDYIVWSGGQPGVSGGGLRQVRAAMRLWNDDSRSRANLNFLRTTNEELPTKLFDNEVRRIMFEDPHDEIEGRFGDGGERSGTLARTWVGTRRSCQPRHRIPGRGTDAVELFGSNIVTQDGLVDQIGRVVNPANYFERIIAHELGHAIGIAHPCERSEANCDGSHPHRGALMFPVVNGRDASRARLHIDDRAAVRYLYPSGGGGSPPPPPPPPTSGGVSFSLAGAECDADLCVTQIGRRVVAEDTTERVDERVWSAGNGQSGTRRRFRPVWEAPGYYTLSLTVTTVDGTTGTTSRRVLVRPADRDRKGECVPGAERHCFLDERYAVEIQVTSAEGETTRAKNAYEGTNDSGLFWFFDKANWEALIKVLDGCDVNGHHWVYGAATTDVGYVVKVTDTKSGAVKEYSNQPGTAAPALTDATAFSGCEP